MDFNTIYEMVAPYLGTSGIVTIILTILIVLIRCRNIINKAEKRINAFIDDIQYKWETTESEALKAFKSALPKDLFINIESLAKEELSKIKNEIWNAVDERWLGQISKNTELTQAIASALLGNKTICDSDKEIIAKMLELDSNTTKKLKVELIETKQKVETKEEKPINNVLID